MDEGEFAGELGLNPALEAVEAHLVGHFCEVVRIFKISILGFLILFFPLSLWFQQV